MAAIYDKKWIDILTAATKHRIAPAPPGPDSISISRASFDDLVSFVEATGPLSIPELAAQSIHVSQAGGLYHCVAENPGLIKATGSGRNMFEALSVALRDFKMKLDERTL